jgi:3'(2'), 5'-bisphosphate nucleotidase
MLNQTEESCLAALQAGTLLNPVELHERLEDRWLEFTLRTVLDAGARIRKSRTHPEALGFKEKQDGSPATRVETEIEQALRERLAVFDPKATLRGEETGGEVTSKGFGVAIDPIDGTWAFLNGTPTSSVTLTVFRDGTPFLGVIGNPDTGEIGYRMVGAKSRLLRLSQFGESTTAVQLPEPSLVDSEILVNVHPGRNILPEITKLYAAWADNRIRMVRSSGGSPSWFFLEAAKGRFIYANAWTGQPSVEFDLAAGLLLVQGAGGDVVDLQGEPIAPVGFRGWLVAGLDPISRSKVVDILQPGSENE